MDELTEEQIEFLNAEGKVVVKACPGSGKTYSVANKLLKYLDNWKCDHQGIAILSFTNVASDEINKKTVSLNSNKVNIDYPHYIGTVDSFLNEYIVLRYGYLKTHDHLRPIIALSDNWKMPFKWWWSACYQNGCVKSIDSFHMGLNNHFYKGKDAVTCEPRGRGLLLPCQQYKNMLYNNNVFFQNDVPLFAYELLKDSPSIASAIVERFPIIIIDEAQDTSEEQMAVFDLLAEHGIRSMFLVGDSDQSIYEWRNANPECFIKKINSESWKCIRFNCNFRCSQNICNAAAFFSSSLKGEKANVAVGYYKDEKQKPIILLFKNYEENKVINYYLTKCKSMGIAVNPESVAVLTRKRIHSDTNIVDLWKSKEIELFAKAAYEWKFESRKKAYNDMSKASFGIVVDKYTDDYHMDRILRDYIDENKWKDFVIETLLCLPDVEIGIAEWIKQAVTIYADILNKYDLKTYDGRKLSDIFKIKKNDKNIPGFREIPLKFYFEKRICSEYTRSSIHGVKGETFDAVLLLVSSTKGKTLTPSFLANGSLENELMRMAYVAMTRPRRLLMIAMPDNQKLKESERFSKKFWDYEYI